jgi:hypothetical protein
VEPKALYPCTYNCFIMIKMNRAAARCGVACKQALLVKTFGVVLMRGE